MTKFICLHCDHEFYGDEIVAKHYDRATGTYDSEECPNCGSEDFEEAAQCSICGEWHSYDCLKGGVCPDCLNKHSTIENAISWGETEREETANYMTYYSVFPSRIAKPIPINSFFAYVYTESEINEILAKDFESVKETFPQKAQEYAANFITDDPSAFAEWFEGRKNK